MLHYKSGNQDYLCVSAEYTRYTAMATMASADFIDYIWAEPIPDELVCAICLEVAEDPCQHGGEVGCGRVFCRDCITRNLRESRYCPTCREPLAIFQDPKSKSCIPLIYKNSSLMYQYTHIGARQIRALKVMCSSLANGCQWVGEVRDLEEHLQSCDYVMVQCTNECYVDYEPCMVIKKDLSYHLANECSKRQSKCQFCNKKGTHAEITIHLKTCTTKFVKCRNYRKCKHSGSRLTMDSHLQECPYEKVPCRYAELGCSETPQRKDLKKHEESDKQTLRVPLGIVLDLMDRVSSLERDMLTTTAATDLEDIIQTVESRTGALENRIVSLESGIAGLSATLEQNLQAATDELNRQGMEIANIQERAPIIETQAEVEVETTPPSSYANEESRRPRIVTKGHMYNTRRNSSSCVCC